MGASECLLMHIHEGALLPLLCAGLFRAALSGEQAGLGWAAVGAGPRDLGQVSLLGTPLPLWSVLGAFPAF